MDVRSAVSCVVVRAPETADPESRCVALTCSDVVRLARTRSRQLVLPMRQQPPQFVASGFRRLRELVSAVTCTSDLKPP